jgi:GTP cyclohydrolase I
MMLLEVKGFRSESTLRPLPGRDGVHRARRVDRPRIERAVREILVAIGEDPDRDGLVETPARVARAYEEVFAGLRQSAADHLTRVFDHEGADGDFVVVRDIEFFSVCEHHLLPFSGRVHVVYLPADHRVVGLSKLARTVDVFARRPQLQERIGSQIANALVNDLGARGAGVIIEASHMCMMMRGASKNRSDTVTSAFRGALQTDSSLRKEALALIGARSDR